MNWLHQNQKASDLIYAAIVAVMLAALATASILPESANAFAVTSQANVGEQDTVASGKQQQEQQLATQLTTMQSNENANNSRSGAAAIRLLDIHTMPSVVHKGDTFKVVATVNNNMQKPIVYTNDCSPLSPSATFNKKIPIVNVKPCNIFPVLQHLNPGENTTIYLPSKFRGDFNATVTGLVHGKVIFNYEIENSNVQQNVSEPFSFTILKQSGGHNNTVTTANLGEIFKLKFNSTALIASENLTMRFVHVNDFRCPQDAICIWEGDGIVSLNVTKDGKDLGTVMLGVNGRLANNTEVVGGKSVGGQSYAIHLLSLNPYPSLSRGPTPQSDYVATLIVTKPDTKISIVSLKEGERDGPLQVTKIFKNHINGLAFEEYPIVKLNGTAVTMKIGDSVSNGCNVSMTLLSIHDRDSAAFLKMVSPPKNCPI